MDGEDISQSKEANQGIKRIVKDTKVIIFTYSRNLKKVAVNPV